MNEQTIRSIKQRIFDEQRKYKDSALDWREIAARKIYSTFVNEWISIEDGLPDEGGYYLVCHESPKEGRKILKAVWKDDAFYLGKGKLPYVTYWMFIPEVPEKF